jgi:hypothetical protein
MLAHQKLVNGRPRWRKVERIERFSEHLVDDRYGIIRASPARPAVISVADLRQFPLPRIDVASPSNQVRCTRLYANASTPHGYT